MTKKIACVLIFFLFSITFLFAASSKKLGLHLQGNGSQNLVDGFRFALTIEANAAGYQIVDSYNAANYQIKYSIEYDQIEEKFKFTVSLIKVKDSSEIITMEYFFADEEEMLLYSQLIFYMLMANLPEEETSSGYVDDTWRDKWLYVNASFDYSLMLLALQGTGLYKGVGIYIGTPPDDIKWISPLDNKIVPMMGAGLGVEFQFLDFMSVEPHVQVSFENVVSNHSMYSLLFSLQIKFPLKFFSSFVIEPYGMAAYPMRFPEENEVFVNYPDFFFGGGIQVAMKITKSSAIFFDVGYMYLGDTGINNYLNEYDPELHSKPDTIYYNHSVLKFSLGYKYGFFDRKTK
jgi:hypothetical protein